MENLIHITGILAVAAAMHIAHTQPSATPKVLKQPSPTTPGNTYYGKWLIPRIFPLLKGAIWVIAIVEIIVVTAPSILSNLSIATPEVFLVNLHATNFSVVGLCLILLGASMRLVCYQALRKFHTFHMCIVEDHKLVTTGPYSIVRHPSYVAIMVVYIGLVLWYFAPGSILIEAGGGTLSGKVVSALGLAFVTKGFSGVRDRITEEDAMLKGAFGAEWENWVDSVPYALVPGLY